MFREFGGVHSMRYAVVTDLVRGRLFFLRVSECFIFMFPQYKHTAVCSRLVYVCIVFCTLFMPCLRVWLRTVIALVDGKYQNTFESIIRFRISNIEFRISILALTSKLRDYSKEIGEMMSTHSIIFHLKMYERKFETLEKCRN